MATPSQGPQADYERAEPGHAEPPPQQTRTAPEAPLAWPGDSEVRIVLWGPTFSGKTTFLGALFLAPERIEGFGTWNIIPLSEESSLFQRAIVKTLEDGHAFPPKTLTEGKPLAWRFVGDLIGSGHSRRLMPFRVPSRLRGGGWNRSGDTVTFTLHIQDLPGEAYDFSKPYPNQNAIIRHLADANALIYLHDPLRDADEFEALTMGFFRDMTEALQTYDPDKLIKGRLHHHVATCVTKFDHPAIYREALKQTFALCDPEPPHAPRVTDENGKAFFAWICDLYRDEGVNYMRAALETKFLPQRVRYYATSAIGFYQKNGQVNLDDCVNSGPVPDPVTGKMVNGIRGPLHPINVLEPLVNLAMAVRKAKPGTPGGGR
ncbi:hypothetical protein [Nonomuraea endophytica]|uniref:Uncharacterized protein n=1 Tax=Nonomuraea endophytica TaxID=714136 RepID=A0A7W8AFH4_9ACTN|nr:hypothetical protein [Nonomuraea endophytica]MBB5083823.1 hypothetical protein [Nonomuraea endophytica]